MFFPVEKTRALRSSLGFHDVPFSGAWSELIGSLGYVKFYLVGGWTNPFEKYERQIVKLDIFPKIRVKKNKNIWVATT